jgi:hypothetical protein
LGRGDITKIGIGIIIALVVIGFLLSLLITAIIGRVIVVAVVIGLGIWVWQQRSSVQDAYTKNRCDLHATFFGVHLDAPKDVVQYCQTHANK